jgi:hypothetical protein
MAPKNWNDPTNTSAVDPSLEWCDVTTRVDGASGTDVGTGAANTTAMDLACTAGAGQAASDYSRNGYSDWFLPSKDELNAMYVYEAAIPAAMVATYGFTSNYYYWTSSQAPTPPENASFQRLDNGDQDTTNKEGELLVRPVRAF